jgi:sortase (surface protein transpeptidase)
MRRVLGRIILYVGILAVISSAGLSAYAYLGENRAKNSNARTTREISEKIQRERLSERARGDSPAQIRYEEQGEVMAAPSAQPPPPEEQSVIEVDGERYIGILSIPALSLRLPVNNEFNEAALNDSPCRFYGDLSGTLIIGAHNTRNHFGRLSAVSGGDEAVITDANGNEHRYAAELAEVLCETDIIGKINSPYDLTLFTCTRSRTERVVVRFTKTGITVIEPAAPFAEPAASAGRVPKAPNYRINYNTETVRIKKGFSYSVDGGASFTSVTEDVTISVSDCITQGMPLRIYRDAANRRPESMVQVLTPVARAKLEGLTLTPARGRLTLDKKYEVYNPQTGRWGKLPRLTGSTELEIRLKNTARQVEGIMLGSAASLPGRLIITNDASRRNGVIAAEIVTELHLSNDTAEDLPPPPDEIIFIRGEHAYYRSDTYNLEADTYYTANTLLYEQVRRITENIITFRPNGQVRPIVAGASPMYRRGLTLREAVNSAQSQGHEVLGGINAGLFDTTNRTPIGLQIRDGVLTGLNFYSQPAVGFLNDGSVILGEPNISINISSQGGTIVADRLNRVRGSGLVYLYTPDFNTHITQDGAVIKTDGKLSLGKTITGTVTQIISGDVPYAIAADEMVLSAGTQGEFLTPGSTVTLTVSCSDTRWNDVAFAVGGLHSLVTDGEVRSVPRSERAPRTAIGITADGSVVLYTADGRQPGHSAGLTLSELAGRMGELGCVTAFNLDGGGSTAMFARLPGEGTAGLVNRPSDGSMRRCADFILLLRQ